MTRIERKRAENTRTISAKFVQRNASLENYCTRAEDFPSCVVTLSCEIKNSDHNMILWTYCVDKPRALYKIKFFVFDVRKIDNSYIFLRLFVYFTNLSLSTTQASAFLNQDFMTILYSFLSDVIIYFLLTLPLSIDKGVKIFYEYQILYLKRKVKWR